LLGETLFDDERGFDDCDSGRPDDRARQTFEDNVEDARVEDLV